MENTHARAHTPTYLPLNILILKTKWNRVIVIIDGRHVQCGQETNIPSFVSFLFFFFFLASWWWVGWGRQTKCLPACWANPLTLRCTPALCDMCLAAIQKLRKWRHLEGRRSMNWDASCSSRIFATCLVNQYIPNQFIGHLKLKSLEKLKIYLKYTKPWVQAPVLWGDRTRERETKAVFWSWLGEGHPVHGWHCHA